MDGFTDKGFERPLGTLIYIIDTRYVGVGFFFFLFVCLSIYSFYLYL